MFLNAYFFYPGPCGVGVFSYYVQKRLKHI